MNRSRRLRKSRRQAAFKKRRYQRQRKKARNLNLKAILLLLFFVLLFIFIKNYDKILVPYEEMKYLYINRSTITYFKNYGEIEEVNFYNYLAAYYAKNEYNLKKYDIENINAFIKSLHWYDKVKINKIYTEQGKILEQALADAECFPVKGITEEFYYEDSYGADRTYGGNRVHLGTDIMDVQNQRGRLEILSITDGIVANMGWNDKGGWRIGINSPSGNYFYYAHLDSYREDLKVGQEVKSGEVLGYMGDTGYSPIPGTTGQFPVHLHLGIMLRDITDEEYWINPYYILKYVEGKSMVDTNFK